MLKLAALLLVLTPSIALADKDFAAADGGSFDCAEDPVVNITQGSGAFTFSGECKEINVNGEKLKLTVASVAALNVNGTGNTIAVESLGSVNINGTKNKITWKKAQSGKKPGALVNGKGNAVAKAK